MSYKRRIIPLELVHGSNLTADMVGIGMNFAAKGSTNPNIEDTLLAASIEALEQSDLRALAVMVTWLGIHHPWINADRLYRGVSTLNSLRVRAFWAAIGQWLCKDRRFAKFAGLYKGPRLPLLDSGNAFQIQRRGEDERFKGALLAVPAGVLRDRPADVLSPADLAKRHATYRQRVLMGPSYRADMWTALEQDPNISAADLARRTYGSFATAWKVKQDWALLTAA